MLFKGRIITVVFLFLMLSCASNIPERLSMSDLMLEMVKAYPNQSYSLYEIPTHGAIPDFLNTITPTSGSQKQLINYLSNMQKESAVIVHGANNSLVASLLNSALDDLEKMDSAKKNTIVYAGEKKYSEGIKLKADKHGFQFYFIDIYKK